MIKKLWITKMYLIIQDVRGVKKWFRLFHAKPIFWGYLPFPFFKSKFFWIKERIHWCSKGKIDLQWEIITPFYQSVVQIYQKPLKALALSSVYIIKRVILDKGKNQHNMFPNYIKLNNHFHQKSNWCYFYKNISIKLWWPQYVSH